MRGLAEDKSKQRDLFLSLGVLLFALATRWGLFYLIPDGQMNDDACFLLRALHLSRPTDVASLPNPVHYAIGWPLLIAPFLKLGFDWYATGRILATGLTCLTSVYLASAFARRTGSRAFGAAVALLFLNAPQTMILGSSLMSEPFYFFLVSACLLGAATIGDLRSALFWGGLSGLCFLTRTEGLLVGVVVCLSLFARGCSWPVVGGYLAGLASVTGFVRGIFRHAEQNTHLRQVKGVWGGDHSPDFWSYTPILGKQSATMALEALLNRSSQAYHLLWLIPIVALTVVLQSKGVRATLPAFCKEPLALWLIGFPFVFYVWPFSNPRYWPLWAVLLFALSLSHLGTRPRWVAMAALLILQLPGAWHWYGMGPLAERFQKELYLPYYRSLSSGQKVLTLNNTRVSSIARVPTEMPLMNSEFQSLPIAMAYTGCDLIEWETTSRTLKSVTGSDARTYPPEALEGLRKSPLFKLEHSCAFSECYRLVADPTSLKEAGSFYSAAMQTNEPKKRLEFLQQAVSAVPGLPETEWAFWNTRLQLTPGDSEATRQLSELSGRYPFLQQR